MVSSTLPLQALFRQHSKEIIHYIPLGILVQTQTSVQSPSSIDTIHFILTNSSQQSAESRTDWMHLNVFDSVCLCPRPSRWRHCRNLKFISSYVLLGILAECCVNLLKWKIIDHLHCNGKPVHRNHQSLKESFLHITAGSGVIWAAQNRFSINREMSHSSSDVTAPLRLELHKCGVSLCPLHLQRENSSS